MKREVRLGSTIHPVCIIPNGTNCVVQIAGRDWKASLRALSAAERRLELDGRGYRLWVARRGEAVYVHAFGRGWEVTLQDPLLSASGSAASAGNTALAPMPGTVVRVDVCAQDTVRKGQTLVVIESMKLETAVSAWRDGIVEAVHVDVGASFERGARLVTLLDQGEH